MTPRLRLLFWVMTFSVSQVLLAQSPLLNNPSRCDTTYALRDFSCPDIGGFFQPNTYTIQVANVAGAALGRDVYLREVRLVIEHEWVADLDLRLQSPGGRTVLLSADNGGGENNYGNPADTCAGYMTFSEGSCVSIKVGLAPFLDRAYRPEESFLNFNDNLTNPNGNWTLLICDDTELDVGSLIFVELVFAPLACLPISAVSVLNQDTTAVTLGWSPEAPCSSGSMVVEYGPVGFTPGIGAAAGAGGQIVRASCPPFALTNLAPQTTYDIYLRRDCGGGQFSDNSCPITITTGCRPPFPRLLETFDQQTVCNSTCGDPCALVGSWRNETGNSYNWLVFQGATPTQGTGPAGDVTGTGKYLYIETSGTQCPAGAKATLLSDCFQLNKQGSQDCHLSFSYHMFGPDIGRLTLEASATGGASWQVVWTAQGNQGDLWQRAYISLDAFPDGAIMQYRFTATRGNGSKGDIALDNIALHGAVALGTPTNRFFADRDGDGYGDPQNSILTCLASPPAGYVRDNTDCSDSNANVNPSRPEIPCDNLDNNCNGIADDLLLPDPQVIGDTICSGQTPNLRAIPAQGSFSFWYTSLTAETGEFSFDNTFSPGPLINTGSEPLLVRFYVSIADDRLRCFSARKEVLVIVNPLPLPFQTETVRICPGTSFDLAATPLVDQHFTGATVSFHSGLPATQANQLSQTLVAPANTRNYGFVMTTPAGCKQEGLVAVNVRPRLLGVLSPLDSFSLCLKSSQVVEVRAAGGTPGYTYRWSTGQETPLITVRASETPGQLDAYQVTVTDAAGCTDQQTLKVLTTVSIDSVRRTVVGVSACNGMNGSILIEPLNGLRPFRYQWSGTNGVRGDTAGIDASSFTIGNLPQGAYRVTITDNSSEGCAFVMSTAYVNGPTAEVRSVQTQPVSCTGLSDGKICLDVRGNPRYTWSTGDTTACVENLVGGMYSVTISEGDCATVVENILVAEPTPVQISGTIKLPSCPTTADAAIDIQVFGGSPNYQYNWSSGPNTQDISRLVRGSYQVSVTDANGCQASREFVVGGPAPVEVALDSLRPISCFGDEDAALVVRGSGGTAPYRYRWLGGELSPSRSELAPGGYRVTVTDLKGCSATRNFTITAPAPLQAEVIGARAPVCEGDETGSITAAALGGTAPYTFRWNTGAQGAVLDQVGIGQYAVQVTDRNGCQSDSLSVNLTAESTLAIDWVVLPVTCQGLTDGIVSAAPRLPGTYTYKWSTGATTNVLFGQPVGDYAVTISDQRGCTVDTVLTISLADYPLAATYAAVAPSCFGSRDGVIDVTITQPGQQPLTYQWNDGEFDEDRSSLRQGTYELTITDQRGCQVVLDSIRLESPPPLSYEVIGRGEINCFGSATGFVEIKPVGGKAPFTYNWVGDTARGPGAYNLKAGSYRVFIQDANGCPAIGDFTFNQPAQLSASIQLTTGDICAGDTTSLLRARVTGGTGPYNFRWSNGRTDSLLQNMPPGDYALLVRDARGCRANVPAVKLRDLGKPLRLEAFTVRDISCFGRRDGQAAVQVSGGVAPFTYLFSNTSQVITNTQGIATVNNLPADTDYSVVVSDARGCRVESGEAAIREPARLSVRRDSVRAVDCFGASSGGIFLTVLGGTKPFAYTWVERATGRPVAATEDLLGFPSGAYICRVTDARLCVDSLPVTTIATASPITLAQQQITDVRCKGELTGSIQVQVQGGTGPYRFAWNGTPGGQNLTGVAAGTYNLSVTDARNCSVGFPGLTVKEPATGITPSANLLPVACYGQRTGSIAISLTGGTEPYQVSWQLPSGQLVLDSMRLHQLPAGRYSLLVTDARQCTRAFNYQLTQPDSLALAFDLQGPAPNSANGSIIARVAGGTPPYKYAWNTGGTQSSLQNIVAGTYQLTVTDANSCQRSRSITLLANNVQELDWVSGFDLYPNPAADWIQVSLRLRKAAGLEWEVVDAGGRLIQRDEQRIQHDHQWQIDARHWPAGSYWLRVRTDQGSFFAVPLVVQSP
ncbi:MAG: T9SS type A sorting domain-containing protein [Lewinellaceae bacterium]|nr:T9SS type A sorting domain-containing protein [Lewinellaceae bacterium]